MNFDDVIANLLFLQKSSEIRYYDIYTGNNINWMEIVDYLPFIMLNFYETTELKKFETNIINF